MRMTFAFFAALLAGSAVASEPQPYRVVPEARQLKWHETECFALVCFGLNTFTGREWGYGETDPSVFNPQKFDAGQVAAAIKSGGMRGLILVAKHHDGFCLWPSATTGYNISKSPWRGGKGDLVREFADAARRHGLKFGIYCSPWDRNNEHYGKPEYLTVYHGQLRELLSNYGTVFEMWFDGANGGDGYYGGAREKRNIDAATYYDWPKTWGIVRELQPMACIFGDVGPDCRWVGNERGYAAAECWATFTPKGKRDVNRPANGDTLNSAESPAGHRDGKIWAAPECDVPLRRGWFWHPDQNGTVKKTKQLMDIYFNSVGRGGCMNLGIAPDRDGLVCPADAESLQVFGNALRSLFERNLADNAKVEADSVRKSDEKEAGRFAPENVLDGDRYTYWATDDGVLQGSLTLLLPEVREFDVVRIRENIRLGQRVEGFAVDVWENNGWREYAKGESVGACRLIHGGKVGTDKVRLRITAAAACPCISEFSLYAQNPAL